MDTPFVNTQRTLMNKPIHRFSDLFAQLGLPCEPDDIATFLAAHAPLADHIKLVDAPFWKPTQAAFLRESLLQDSDWSGPADQLNQSLRAVKN
jgi:Protein of unknown function (DUF2789)